MGRLRALIMAAFTAALAPGCITVKVDWPGKTKSSLPAETTARQEPNGEKSAQPKADGGVKQAAAFLPAVPMVTPALPKMFAAANNAKSSAAHIMTLWRDKVEYLPDPSRNGSMGAGIVGQLFLYSPDLKHASANGSLTIEMFDESAKTNRGEPVYLGKWRFEKDVLKQLVTIDERWGKSYALFLPWPDYKADITRVKLTVRYDQEGGFTLFAPTTTVTFNTNVPGLPGSQSPNSMSPIGGPPPLSSVNPGAAPAPLPANLPVGVNPIAPQMPVNAAPIPVMAAPASSRQPTGPAGLPPIVTINPGR